MLIVKDASLSQCFTIWEVSRQLKTTVPTNQALRHMPLNIESLLYSLTLHQETLKGINPTESLLSNGKLAMVLACTATPQLSLGPKTLTCTLTLARSCQRSLKSISTLQKELDRSLATLWVEMALL